MDKVVGSDLVKSWRRANQLSSEFAHRGGLCYRILMAGEHHRAGLYNPASKIIPFLKSANSFLTSRVEHLTLTEEGGVNPTPREN